MYLPDVVAKRQKENQGCFEYASRGSGGDVRVAKAKCGLGLADRDLTRNFGDVLVERAADVVVVAKNERLFGLESDGNNIFRVF